MGITILGILIFLSSLCFVFGVWQFLWIVIHKKGYELEKLENETFYDFLFRYYEDDFFWKLRKRYGARWFYRSKAFLLFMKIKGVLLILSSVLIALGTFLLSESEYAVFLQITF